jgi:DNA-binding transcriptional MerR regulator
MSQTISTTTLKIGALARATGTSVRSIRHYDQHGLLASTRAENGYREFAQVAVTQVKQLQRLMAMGFNLDEIRSFPDCMLLIEGAKACANISDARRKRLAILQRQIEALETQRQHLRAMLIESTEHDRHPSGMTDSNKGSRTET